MNNTTAHPSLKPSYIREILEAATNAETISLAGGLPATNSFPAARIRDAASKILEDPGALQYSTTEGEPELRHWIADSLSAAFNTGIDQILITNGAQQAMDLIARTLLEPGDNVVVEVPAYLGALQVFNLARANILAIEQTTTGPDLNELEAAFRQQPKLFYAVSDFHNPTGVCWPLEKRQQVIALAKQYRVSILEDAPYRDLRYSGRTLPTLYELASEQTYHIGSFSKVVAPGLRLGYLCAKSGAGLGDAGSAISQMAIVKQTTDLHSSNLCQRLLMSCLQEPFYSEHLNRLRKQYRRQRDTLVQAVHEYLGERVDFSVPEGGLFLWLSTLNLDTDKLAECALRQDIAIVPSSVFYPKLGAHTKAMAKHKMRLNFSHSGPACLVEGVKRLASVIESI